MQTLFVVEPNEMPGRVCFFYSKATRGARGRFRNICSVVSQSDRFTLFGAYQPSVDKHAVIFSISQRERRRLPQGVTAAELLVLPSSLTVTAVLSLCLPRSTQHPRN
jgi:hypothetical protein